MGRKFTHRIVVTIGDTNMERNVYWVNYCKWFGQVRELFLMSLMPAGEHIREFLESRRVSMATCDVSVKFLRPAFFGDGIVAELWTERVRRCSLELVIEFRDEKSGEALATGRQKVAFLDADTQKVRAMPEELRGGLVISD